MKGMNENGFLRSSRHSAAVKGNSSPISAEDAMHAPAMETGRLLCDDGSTAPCRPTAEKTQRGCRVAGLATGRLDAQLRNRQEYHDMKSNHPKKRHFYNGWWTD